MCRLYSHFSTHEETVSCELLDSQNSLIKQSKQDQRGLSNPHGWGLGYFHEGKVACIRQPEPASSDIDFRREVEGICTRMLVAHIRRATVGTSKLENTHPFLDGRSMLAHNGHIETLSEIQSNIDASLSPERRKNIYGDTDSEQIFQLLLTRQDNHPNESPLESLRTVIKTIETWSNEVDPTAELALNLIWIHESQIIGSRYNRTLFYHEQEAPHICEGCGNKHLEESVDDDYYAVEIASEPINDDDWKEIDNKSVFLVSDDQNIRTEPLSP